MKISLNRFAPFLFLALTAANGASAAAAREEPKVTEGTCNKPVYPEASRQSEHQGVVTVGFLIGRDGTVRDTKILSSSGHRALDTSAATALSACRFRPARSGGQPAELWLPMNYVWALTGETGITVEQHVRRAAEKGSLDAKYALSSLAGDKTPAGEAERLNWLRSAAEGGHPFAQYILGETYRRGHRVAVDHEQGMAWLQKAAAQGNVLARQRLQALAPPTKRGAPAP